MAISILKSILGNDVLSFTFLIGEIYLDQNIYDKELILTFNTLFQTNRHFPKFTHHIFIVKKNTRIIFYVGS